MDGFGGGEAQLTARTSHAATAPPSRRPTGMARRGDFGGCGNDGAGVTLQLCRPLSGAVIRYPAAPGECPAASSIVPPPFGSGYGLCVLAFFLRQPELQSCRPLSGAVMSEAAGQVKLGVVASIVPPPFGSGYVILVGPDKPDFGASIVPPPFGSGYVCRGVKD